MNVLIQGQLQFCTRAPSHLSAIPNTCFSVSNSERGLISICKGLASAETPGVQLISASKPGLCEVTGSDLPACLGPGLSARRARTLGSWIICSVSTFPNKKSLKA